MKKEGCAQVVPTAEVRLGRYVAKFTEKDLQELYDLIEFVRDDLMNTIRKYDDFIIDAFREDNTKAEVCMRNLDGLRGYVWWFNRVVGIDIKREDEQT